MKTRLYIFLFIMLSTLTSFIHKDLNEYGKWLEFHGLKDEDFMQIGKDKQIAFGWKSYDLTNEYKQLYDSLYFYSPDSTYFLDLDSYSVILEKDSKGNLTWMEGDPDSKIQLVKTKNLDASTLLFFGTVEFAETAIWRNEYLFEIFGFTTENDKYIPTIWKYDLYTKTTKEFKSKKTLTKPKSYLTEMRLKTIKYK